MAISSSSEDSDESNHHQNKSCIIGSSSAKHIKNGDKSSSSSPPSKVQVDDVDIAEEEEQPHKEEQEEEPAVEQEVDDELNSLIKLLKDLEWQPHKGPYPPGYKFDPSDYDLIVHYLIQKILNHDLPAPNLIVEVELSKHSPKSLIGSS